MHTSAPLDLRWIEDEDGGYACLDGNVAVGRVVQVPAGMPMHPDWQWFVGFLHPDGNRYRSSRREAMLAVECAVEWQHAKFPNARDMAPYPVRR